MSPGDGSAVSILTMILVHLVLSECGIPLARDSPKTPESLTDLIKNNVEARSLIRSRKSFEEPASPVHRGLPEGLNTPGRAEHTQRGRSGSRQQSVNYIV